MKKIVIEIVDDDYNRIKSYLGGKTFYPITARLYKAVKNGTPIPDNATNGDVIKAMFPNVEIRFFTTFSGIHTVDVDFKDNTLGRTYSVHTFNLDWWNAPYQEGGK